MAADILQPKTSLTNVAAKQICVAETRSILTQALFCSATFRKDFFFILESLYVISQLSKFMFTISIVLHVFQVRL